MFFNSVAGVGINKELFGTAPVLVDTGATVTSFLCFFFTGSACCEDDSFFSSNSLTVFSFPSFAATYSASFSTTSIGDSLDSTVAAGILSFNLSVVVDNKSPAADDDEPSASAEFNRLTTFK